MWYSVNNFLMNFIVLRRMYLKYCCKIFFSLQQISPDILPLPIRDLLGNEIGNVAKLAVVILLEQKLGLVRTWFGWLFRR